MKHWYKWLFGGIGAVACGVLGLCSWLRGYLPDTYRVVQGQTLVLAQTPYVTATAAIRGNGQPVDASANAGAYSMQLRLFGVLPLKTVWVQPAEQKSVMVSGAPFGIKLFSDGVMVVGFGDIYTTTGYQNPAKSAGLHMGDTIRSVAGVPVATNEDVQKLMEGSEGRPVQVTFVRNGTEQTVFLTPVQDVSNGAWRAGMRVRDSSAGIGTLTYYDIDTGAFAGLGHAVTDVDTGDAITVLSGQIVPVTITGVAPSSVGSPGELKGTLEASTAGDIYINSGAGVFGLLRQAEQPSFAGQRYMVASRQQVRVGEAVLYACIEGQTPRAYAVIIERISYDEGNPNKNMIVRVTDAALLEATGGIVQGMSGSPLVQDGYLVGAVTHVLVNDPTRGYAIFAENMLEAQTAMEQQQSMQNAA